MAGLIPDKPINEKTRAEEEEGDAKVETLTGPLDYDLSDSILNLREEDRDSNLLQQEFRDYSCFAIDEVNKNSYASSSSKPKEHVMMYKRCLHDASSSSQEELELSEYERSQVHSMFGLLGIEDDSNQSSHQPMMPLQDNLGLLAQKPNLAQPLEGNVTQPPKKDQTMNQQIIVPNRGVGSDSASASSASASSSSSSSSAARSDLNPNASPWRPRNTYQQQIPRSNQSMNQQQQQFTILNHGSGSVSTSDHQNTLNPNASPWRPRSMNQQQHQFSIPNHGSTSSATSDQNQQFGRQLQLNPSALPWRPQQQQQQQFTIPNRASISSATSDQNQPFGRQLQLNPSATPWRPQHPVDNQRQTQMMIPMQNQMYRNNFNQNFSVMQQPQHFPRPETNQMYYHQQGDLRSVAPSGLQQFGLLDPEVAAAQQQWFDRNQQLQTQQTRRAQGFNAEPSSDQRNLK